VKEYFVSKKAAEASKKAAEEEVAPETSTPATDSSPPQPQNLVLLRVRQLLPLLVKEELLNQDDFWAAGVDWAAVEASLDSIARDLRQHRDDSLSAVLQTVHAPTSPNTKENPNALPTLKAHGVSLEDRRVHENLLRDLHAVNENHASSNTLHCMLRDNFTSAFVRVPSSKGFVRMKKNANETKWLHDVLTALGGPDNFYESLLDLLTYVAQNEECKATWEEAARANGLIVPVLDAVSTKAVQSLCDMNKSQMKQLRSCLKTELGLSMFCTECRITQVLGIEHVTPTTGMCKHGKERIEWSYKPVTEVLKLWLKSRLEGPNGCKANHLDDAS
jgi:hypothetical protein